MGISLHGGSVGQPGVGSFTGDFWDMVERGSGGGVSLFVGALSREPGGRVPLLGTLKDM
jgi:hypothetical protein